MNLRKFFTVAVLLSVISIHAYANALDKPFPKTIQKYIKTLHKRYHFTEEELTTLFSNVTIDSGLIDRMNHPYEAKSWPVYRKLFITPTRVNNGLSFWEKHQKILEKAQRTYGVPASIIVAIIGVETSYGQRAGNYPILNTLITLGFYYKPRQKFFRKELTEYLLLTREQKLQPQALTGSYAGAIGIPQFMPSTYRRYAVGYTKQGSADLVHNTDDAIFSIANYLKHMGWKAKQPIAHQFTPKTALNESLISSSAKPNTRLTALKQKGIPIPRQTNPQLSAAIIKLASEREPAASDYWLTFTNFRAIMRYNPNINYAMAVHQLSEAIKNARQQATTTTRAKPTPARTT